MEGDAPILVKTIQNEETDHLSWYRGLIEDAKETLKTRPNWSMSFDYRNGNKIVNSLAKLGLSPKEERVWIEDESTVINSVVQAKLVNQQKCHFGFDKKIIILI